MDSRAGDATIPPAMSAREVPQRFRVAISYAGEQRGIVQPIAEAIERSLGPSTVFYDKWYEEYLSVADGDTRLQEIYARRCDVAVVCVSGEYGRKGWTLTEHRAIRSRLLLAQSAGNTVEEEAILHLRVAPGDLPGLQAVTILQDAAAIGTDAAADLVLQRVRRLAGLAAGQVALAADDGWPVQPPELSWPVADHAHVRQAFGALLLRGADRRLTLVRGPSGTGKSYITHELAANARAILGVAVGRFDFKGTARIEEELPRFALKLDIDVPVAWPRLTDSLGLVFERLRRAARPTLLIFDTYQDASGDAKAWITHQLLPELVRARWLRVVIVGREVPSAVDTVWQSVAAPLVEMKAPSPSDWYAWARRHRDDLTLADVEAFCRVTRNNVSALYAWLGNPNQAQD